MPCAVEARHALLSSTIASAACSQRRLPRGQRDSAATGRQRALEDATAAAAGTEGLWAMINERELRMHECVCSTRAKERGALREGGKGEGGGGGGMPLQAGSWAAHIVERGQNRQARRAKQNKLPVLYFLFFSGLGIARHSAPSVACEGGVTGRGRKHY